MQRLVIDLDGVFDKVPGYIAVGIARLRIHLKHELGKIHFRIFHQLLCLDPVHDDGLSIKTVWRPAPHIVAFGTPGIESVLHTHLDAFTFKLGKDNGEINDESYRVNVRGAEIEQQKAMVAIVASLFMYIAFILISAVGTILAVQSLSDSTKYKYRYLTLRRLGINDKSLFKTIRKQLLILFCVPAISAILCSFVMMSSLNNVYQQILGDKHLYLIYFGLNLIIFFLIYSIYWIATYIGFKRNINEAS